MQAGVSGEPISAPNCFLAPIPRPPQRSRPSLVSPIVDAMRASLPLSRGRKPPAGRRPAVAEGVLMKGGGHAMAAGVTLKTGALGEFRAFLEQHLGADVEAARRDDALLVDGALTARAVTVEMVATLAAAGPFGAGNPEPGIALPAPPIAHSGEGGHAPVPAPVRARDRAALDAIAFRAAGQKLGQALLKHRGRV